MMASLRSLLRPSQELTKPLFFVSRSRFFSICPATRRPLGRPQALNTVLPSSQYEKIWMRQRSLQPRCASRRYNSRSGQRPDYDAMVRNAKPLVTPEQIKEFFKGATFKWIIICSVAGSGLFYYVHIEEVPVSGRKRFNCMSKESMDEIGQHAYMLTMHQYQRLLLPTWDPRVRLVKKVMAKLAPVSGMPDEKWEVFVIDEPRQANAFVLPGGKVFVFSGILPICGSEDGLATVLGHEIAHNLAQHQAERQSQSFILNSLVMGLYIIDFTRLLVPALMQVLISIGIDRPASRKQEAEADYIGLLMMAQACYNPEAAVTVWERMERRFHNEEQIPEWLSTHPSNENRILKIKEWLPTALAMREKSECSATMGFAREFGRAMRGPQYIRLI